MISKTDAILIARRVMAIRRFEVIDHPVAFATSFQVEERDLSGWEVHFKIASPIGPLTQFVCVCEASGDAFLISGGPEMRMRPIIKDGKPVEPSS